MRKLFGLLILCLSVILGGCTTDPIDPVATDPTHIYEEVREDFLIDAEVITFPGDGSVTIYEATPGLLTKSQVVDFLAANGDHVTEWKELDPEYDIGYACTTAYGGGFSSSTSSTGLFPGGLFYSTSMDDRWSNCHIYPGQQFYNGNEAFSFAHLFTKPIDFDFATAQEAEAKVRDMLAILGLNDLTLNRILYIDHEILANEVTPILRTEEWQSMDKSGFIPTYDDWSVTDDGYIFEFVLNLNGVPMFSEYLSLDTVNYIGDTIQVWYQASGIVKLTADGSLWNIGKPVEQSTNRISAQNALQIARIRLENNKVSTNTAIQKISAEYFYELDGERFVMRPVWVVYAKVTNTYVAFNHEYISSNCIIIDAITGDELY